MRGTLAVLVLEDDPEWARYTESILRAEGWSCVLVDSVSAALDAAVAQDARFDAIVLDRNLHDGLEDGLELIPHLDRLGVSVPRIVTSLWGSAAQRVEGIEAGADDYLPKPFDGAELVARLRRRMKRQSTNPYEGVLLVGPLELRPTTGAATWQGARLDLTPQSFSLLLVLAENVDRPVELLTLWNRVWPHEIGPVREVLIQQAIKNLRAKIGAVGDRAVIRTVSGVGYMLSRSPNLAEP